MNVDEYLASASGNQIAPKKMSVDEFLGISAPDKAKEPSDKKVSVKNYGLREDNTQKGQGYFGPLSRPDGNISTELSIGVNIDGKDLEIPSLVPTLSLEERNYLLSGKSPTETIVRKAVDHAKMRLAEGKNPFAQKEDLPDTQISPAKKMSVDEFLGISGDTATLDQGKSSSMLERGKEFVKETISKVPDFTTQFAPESNVPKGMEGMPESTIPAGIPNDISARKEEINKRLGELTRPKQKDEQDDRKAIEKRLGNIKSLEIKIGEITSKAVDNALPPDLYEQYTKLRPQYEKAIEDYNVEINAHNVRIEEAKNLIGELEDLKQAEYGIKMIHPVSTITSKPIPTPEEVAKGGKAAMALAPYGAVSLARGMIPRAAEKAIAQPITKAVTGKDYTSYIDKGISKFGEYLPEDTQKVVGGASQMAGAIAPISMSFKVANAMMKAFGLPIDLVLKTGPVIDQIAGHIVRGGLAGGLYGLLEEGTPEGVAKDAAFFGTLEGALGATGQIFKKIFSTNWYRNLEVKERGLVVQSIDDLRQAGHSEGTILRTINNPAERDKLFQEAIKKRMAPEQPPQAGPSAKTEPVISPNIEEAIKKPSLLKPVAETPKELVAEQVVGKTMADAFTAKYGPELGSKVPPGLIAKESKLRTSSEKIKAQTPAMLKESDRVNDVELGTLVEYASKDPAKAIQHASEATVSKDKLIEGLRNKGLKAIADAPKEQRAGIRKNLEETLRGIKGEGEITAKVEAPAIEIPELKGSPEAVEFGKTATPKQVEQLKVKRDEAYAESDRLQAEAKEAYAGGDGLTGENKLNDAVIASSKANLYREAIDASEGKLTGPPPMTPIIPGTRPKGIETIEAEGEVKPAEAKAEKQSWEMGGDEWLASPEGQERLKNAKQEVINDEIRIIGATFKKKGITGQDKLILSRSLDKTKRGQLEGFAQRRAELIALGTLDNKGHKGIIKQALSEGNLTPERYTELHEKDYGPLEEFMPAEAKETEPVAPPATQEPGSIDPKFPVKDLFIDAKTLQYKRFTDEKGVTGKLSDAEEFDEKFGGVLTVWRDPKTGKVFVSNGHQRYDIAQRTGKETVPVRFSKVKTAEEAKYEGALINIAENNGSPEDAAVIFREYGLTADDVNKKYHISLKGDIARKGLALSRLHPTIFNSVEKREIPQNWGVTIGENLDNQDMQIDLIRYLDKVKRSGKTVNIGVLEQLIKDINGEVVGTVEVKDGVIFGPESFERPLLMERAELRDYAVNELAKEKRLFGTVGQEGAAKKLTIGGNIIDVNKSKTVAEKAALIKDIFEKLAGSKGEISNELNKYAEELSNVRSKGEKDRIKRDFLERLRETINEFIKGGKGTDIKIGRGDAKTGAYKDTERLEDNLLKPEQYEFGKSIPVKGDESLLDILRKAPPLKNTTMGISPDGSVWVRNKNGKGFVVRSVKQIEPNKADLLISHGKMLEKGEFITGKYKDSSIELVRGTGEEPWTATHESIHFFEDLGYISSIEKAIMSNHIKRLQKEGKWDSGNREVGGEEDRAVFITENLRDRSIKGPLGRILQKISDLIDAFVNLFKRTAKGVMRDIESGKVFDRDLGKPSRKVRVKALEQYQALKHGTPHVWPPEKGYPHGRPRLDKIGTGEGAAAYGHGFYVAEAEEVARSYKETLQRAIADKIVIDGKQIDRFERNDVAWALEDMGYEHDLAWTAADWLMNKGLKENKNMAADRGLERLHNVFSKIKEVPIQEGSLYTLELPDDVLPKLLDWDKPLSEQSEYVKEVLAKTEYAPFLSGKDPENASLHDRFGVWRPKDLNPERIYYELSAKMGGQSQASEYLASIGIPGNKYLDAGSRNRTEWVAKHPQGGENVFNTKGEAEAFIKRNPEYELIPPKQTSNFVIWDQTVLDRMALLERNGEKLDTIRLGDAKANLFENIKSEKGSSDLINDLSQLGADAIKRGHKSYKDFVSYMKAELKDVWNRVKPLMLRAYDAAKKVLKSERGAIEIGAEKDIIKRRREKIKAIRDYFNLSDNDLKKISWKDIRLMSNYEFEQFIDYIKVKFGEDRYLGNIFVTPEGREQTIAEKFVERQQAMNELELLRKEKAFIAEDNIRKFHKLPTIKNMTKNQLTEYLGILSKYEKGDQFLTPKRIKGIEKTLWAGSKTIREVLEKASKEFDIPMSELAKIRVHEIDRFRYDTSLAKQNAFYNFMVDTIKTAEIKNQFKYFKEREKLYSLAKLALKSKKRGIIGRLIPRQKELMEYLEAEEDAKIEIATKLTTEEIALADGIEDFYRRAYNWLLINQELKNSRFADSKYVFHSKRPISEMLVDLKDTGIKSAAKDLLRRWQLDEAQFKILDSKTGKILRMKKFFRQTLYRTGELTPTKNIIKATDIYMQQFFKKMALDESVPAIETLALALRPKEKTKTGIFLNDSLITFVKEYLNNKKGRTLNIGIQQGGKIDTVIRFVNQMISLRYIALNIPLELAAIVGETTAKLPALGNRKLILANIRRHTPKGRRILKKYKAFTGEGVFEEVMQPARNIGENINMVLYGLFKWSRKVTKQDILLGNMTREEFKAETIDPKKLAEVTKLAGRWLDIEGSKSILGSTSTGAAITKFKGWAIPIASSTIQDVNSLARTLTRLGNPKKRLTREQFQELYRFAETGAILTAILSLTSDDYDKDSFAGKLKYYAIRELGTLYNALTPFTLLTFGVTIAFLEKLSKNLYLLMTLEKYKTRDELKGATALKKQFEPAAISQFKHDKPKKKKSSVVGYSPWKISSGSVK